MKSGMLLAVLLAAVSITLNEAQQNNLMAICRMAVKSPAVDDATTASAVQVCGEFRSLIEAAKTADEAKKDAK